MSIELSLRAGPGYNPRARGHGRWQSSRTPAVIFRSSGHTRVGIGVLEYRHGKISEKGGFPGKQGASVPGARSDSAGFIAVATQDEYYDAWVAHGSGILTVFGRNDGIGRKL